jgi:hypothetical protein
MPREEPQNQISKVMPTEEPQDQAGKVMPKDEPATGEKGVVRRLGFQKNKKKEPKSGKQSVQLDSIMPRNISVNEEDEEDSFFGGSVRMLMLLCQ